MDRRPSFHEVASRQPDCIDAKVTIFILAYRYKLVHKPLNPMKRVKDWGPRIRVSDGATNSACRIEPFNMRIGASAADDHLGTGAWLPHITLTRKAEAIWAISSPRSGETSLLVNIGSLSVKRLACYGFSVPGQQ